MNIDNIIWASIDAVSAAISFVLVWFMTKPYRYTGERKYIGLPFGFSFLGASYFIGLIGFFLESGSFLDVLRWVQLFTQSYAFVFLAVTYYFSKKEKDTTLSWFAIAFAAILLAAVVSYTVILVAPLYDLPHFDTVDDYMRIFNMVFLSYIAIHTLRSHATRPDAKTIWIPLSYLLFDFGQYSLLIWSLDGSFTAFVGAHFLRLVALLVFLFVAYQTFYASNEAYPRRGLNEKDTSQR
jgi:hypothetical protein